MRGEFGRRRPTSYRLRGMRSGGHIEAEGRDRGSGPTASGRHRVRLLLLPGGVRLREGVESIMVNCNPETVSTDYTSDRLYFEPLTFERDEHRRAKDHGCRPPGGQTPLKLSRRLHEAGVPILGTGFDAIDLAEDRERFAHLSAISVCNSRAGTARTVSEVFDVVADIGYPLLLRPSYVLGGRAIDGYTIGNSERSVEDAFRSSGGHPLLIDSYIEDATEADLMRSRRRICWWADHGTHREADPPGDSTALLPPHNLSAQAQNEMIGITRRVTEAMSVEVW